MKHFLQLAFISIALACAAPSLAQVVVTDDGSGTGTTTWTSDNTYVLDGFVFVNDGDVLTIEAGTVVKGRGGSGADASALVVARGGQIQANGTAEAPIVFTFEDDALDGSTPYDVRGQWGGVILLGSAQLNSSPGETQIEGIPDTEPRGLYGGDDDMDGSGTMTYVSIRHGGTDIGAGNEINGLTLGGVGSGTSLHHIEVISNADDGVEFFGGTASIKHVLTAFCGDDSFDYDEGWRGYGQFWCTVQDEGEGDRGGEHDGGTDPEDGAPYAHPVIHNATYVGRGAEAGRRALTMRDNAGGEYHNSIFYNWGKGVDIENLASGEDSYARFESAELALAGNVFDACTSLGSEATASDLFTISMGSGWSSEADSAAAAMSSMEAFTASFEGNGNSTAASGLGYMLVEGSGMLDLVPGSDLEATSEVTIEWFDTTAYPGAFDPESDCTWLDGWSMLSSRGFIGCESNVTDVATSRPSLEVYPNPSNGQFAVNVSPNATWTQVQVTDLTGKLMFHDAFRATGSTTMFLNLQHLPKGMYVLTLGQGPTAQTTKLILE